VESSRPHIDLGLLGGFRLTFENEPLTLSGPAQRLIAHLAVVQRQRPVGRLALAERLWCDTPSQRASASLRSVLWRLPRPRGRTLVTGASTSVRLSEDVRVDLWQGEEQAKLLCEEPEPHGVTATNLAVLRDDLLPDWEEDWLTVEQESYRQKRLHALERSAAALCADGRYTDALSVGLSAVSAEPLRESAHRRVVEVHLAEGNPSEALRHYETYRRLLARELGLPPSSQLRAMVAPLLGRPTDHAALA
jgi:DNA-binding SARP family transcriptional activator